MADELELLRTLGPELAQPDEASVNRARGLLQRRIDADAPRVRVWRGFHVGWGMTGAMAVLLAGSFALGAWLSPSSEARPGLRGVGFLPTPGWTVVQSETAASSRALVSNVEIDAVDAQSDIPYPTLRRLPSHGVVIVARVSPRGDEHVDRRFRLSRLPLRIEDAVSVVVPSVLADSAIIPVRVRRGVAGYNVDVRVFFGGTPSADTIAAVDRQLQRLVVAGEGVTLVVSPRIVRAGERLSIFGSVSSAGAGEKVTIQFKQCGLRPPQFRDRLETTTREGGGYSFAEQRPFVMGVSGVFRAVWGGSVSSEVPVQERAFVSLRRERGGRFQVYVSGVLPFWRKQVLLQRYERRRGIWITVRSLVLTEQLGGGPGAAQPFQTTSPVTTRTALFRPGVPKATTIRAVFPLSQARPCYLAGYSQLVRT